MRTWPTRSPSLTSTSRRMPSRSTFRRRLGTRPSHSLTRPPTVVDSMSSSAVEAVHQIGDAIEIEAAGDDEAALAILGDVAFGFVLVADFADDDFQQVFHGGDAGGVAVLVHDDDHVAVLLLHLAHQVADRFGLRHQADRCAPVRARCPARARLLPVRTCRAHGRSR